MASQEKAISTAKKILDGSDLSKILAGTPFGNELYSMRRTRDKLNKEDPHGSDLILVKSAIEQLLVAQQLTPDKLLSHSASERRNYIETLTPTEFAWPAESEGLLVGQAAKAKVVERPLQLEALMSIIRPYATEPAMEVAFDALNPTLSASSATENERARAFIRITVKEVLVPKVSQGQGAGQEAAELANKIIELVQELEQGHSRSRPVLAAAFKDLCVCCNALLALLDASTGDQKSLALVADAKDGFLQDLRNALQQTPYYRKLLQDFKQAEVAHATMGPQLRSCATAVEAELKARKVSTVTLETAFQGLPLWCKSLRAGATKALEGFVAEHAEMLLDQSGAILELEAFCRLLTSHMQSCLEMEEPRAATCVMWVAFQKTCAKTDPIGQGMRRGA